MWEFVLRRLLVYIVSHIPNVIMYIKTCKNQSTKFDEWQIENTNHWEACKLALDHSFNCKIEAFG